jgi:NAD(P)-dependent dehydrogenase (short-subunit alcohol dehydrogenase family)
MSPPPVALITGGSGALATALASLLRENGWTVHAPGRCEMEVTSASAVQDYFSRIPRLDLLVNNAAIRRDALHLQQSPADVSAVLDTCLRGAFLCSREAARLMIPARSGHIVNIGSWSGRHGAAGQTAYAAAKAGLDGLTRALAAELGSCGIRVNCIHPGWMETPFTRTVPATVCERALSAHLLGRFNTPEDAARFIHHLSSQPAISGQVFQTDSRVP